MSESSMTPEQIRDWIWSNCKEDGDCLLWQGACPEKHGASMRLPGTRKVVPVRRTLMEALGKSVKGYVATSTCENPRCMADEHCVIWTRKQLQKRNGQKLSVNVVFASKIARYRRNTFAVLTEDAVRDIRASGMSAKEGAQKYGVWKSTIQKVINGENRKEYGRNPFAGLGA